MIVRTAGSQKQSQVIDITPNQSSKIMHYTVEYDTTHPEETIRKFCADIRNMTARYEGNKQRLIEVERELQDIMHYIEIASYQTVPNGYKLYRKFAELRRERRALKNESDMLQPLYDAFKQSDILNRLGKIQGEAAKAHEAVDARVYGMRTDILSELLEPKKKEETDVNVITVEEDKEATDIPVLQVAQEKIKKAMGALVERVNAAVGGANA